MCSACLVIRKKCMCTLMLFLSFSLDVSHISDSSFECFSTNPLTGSVCVCRRSPRLLASGYYVLTEDSFTTDDEGNVTLTPSHTSVSYKENLVRWDLLQCLLLLLCVCMNISLQLCYTLYTSTCSHIPCCDCIIFTVHCRHINCLSLLKNVYIFKF